MHNHLMGVVAIAALASCDPIWEVKNPATAAKHVDAACLEAGLRAWQPDVKDVGKSELDHGNVVELHLHSAATANHELTVRWDARTADTIQLYIHAVGSTADPKAVEAFRAARPAIVSSIEQACGTTITLGAETCYRCE